MKAAVIREFCDADVLKYEEIGYIRVSQMV